MTAQPVPSTLPRRSPLLPDRYPIDDFFICDVTDAIPKDDLGSMEHPIFSLSTKPDRHIQHYEHNGVATIHDKDVLIYCISQLIAKMNAGEMPNRTLHLKAYDLLVSTNRKTDGRGYEQLIAAFDRLSGTRIKTNIRTNAEEIREGFGLLDSWRVVRHSASGRMMEVKVTLSEWVFNAVLGREVLTLHRDYFRLRKPLERRMYELARKHCGQQEQWQITLDVLRKKCGSASTEKEFRRLVTRICTEDAEHHHMPDYAVRMQGELVCFSKREHLKDYGNEGGALPLLDADVYERAKQAAPSHDVYYLEQEWRNWWVESGKPLLQHPAHAFIAFCRRRYERCPNP
ncbi:MAG: replication initiator protein A [Chloroflexota bacterium]